MLPLKILRRKKPHLARSKISPTQLTIPLRYCLIYPMAVFQTHRPMQWSRTQFGDLFAKPAQAVNAYLSEPNYLENTAKYSSQSKEQIDQILSYLVTNKPLTFEECIVWARLQFERDYGNDIRQLLFSLPKDAVTSTGQPFWSGPKRAPDPLIFNSNDVGHIPFFILPAVNGMPQACAPGIHHFRS